MREILFRGKRFDGGEWAEGFFYQHPLTKECFIGVHDFNSYSIAYMGNLGCPVFSKIIPETLGQYTGLKDKNGVRIFEGDIVDCWSDGVNAKGTVQQRRDGMWIIFPAWQNTIMWGLCPDEHCNTTVTVIGNIHDNPEIAEGAR
jgi:uncharacterized phage protein (TIGR01671 family)